MSEQYNHIFVFGHSLSRAELSRVIADGLSPVWGVLGRPAHLLTLNVDEGIEQHADVSSRIDENLLQCPSGAILSIRGVESGFGTVQYYELAKHGVISISRPFRLLSPQQRFDWMRLLWSRLQPEGAIFAVSGREAELEASDVEAGIRDWTKLRSVPLLELAVLSDSLVLEAPSGATPVSDGLLFWLQPDESGGLGTH